VIQVQPTLKLIGSLTPVRGFSLEAARDIVKMIEQACLSVLFCSGFVQKVNL